MQPAQRGQASDESEARGHVTVTALQKSAVVKDQSSSLLSCSARKNVSPDAASPTVLEQSRSFSFKEWYLLNECTRLHVGSGFFTNSKPIFLHCLLPPSFLIRFIFKEVY